MNRRGFLGAILAGCAAPAIVRADALMRVVPLGTDVLTLDTIRRGAAILDGAMWVPADDWALALHDVYAGGTGVVRTGEIGRIEGFRIVTSLVLPVAKHVPRRRWLL
jgi:hypothetical protein